MTWTRADDQALLEADLAAGRAQVSWTENGALRHAPLSGLP
jgi:hypothetical protein